MTLNDMRTSRTREPEMLWRARGAPGPMMAYRGPKGSISIFEIISLIGNGMLPLWCFEDHEGEIVRCRSLEAAELSLWQVYWGPSAQI